MSDHLFFEQLIEKYSNELVLISDEQGFIKHVKGALQSVNFNFEDLIGLQISNLIVEKDSPFIHPLLNRCNQEVVGLLKYTKAQQIAIQSHIYYEDKNSLYVIYIKPTSSFYSEKKGLEQIKIFYENLLNNLPVDVVVFSPDHKYLYINKIALSDEKKRNWLIGKTDQEYAEKFQLAPSHIKGRKETFRKVIETGNLIEYEEEFKGKYKNGSSKWLLRHFKPIYNSLGEIEFVLGFGLDISDRKKAEIETLKNLEKQKELIQLKNKFVSTISHEFRTPLATIRGSIDLLTMFLEKNQIKHPKINQFIVNVNNEVFNLNNLLNEVLMIGRHDVSLTPVNFTNGNLLELIKKIVAQNFPYLDNRKITVISKTPNHAIQFDPKLMFHVLSNILSNAVKYSQKDIIVVLKEYKKVTTVTIEDFGIGIPEHEQSKLFNSFYRASNSINYQGTGLGLVIVKNFIELHQGKIELVSQLNVGTKFKITIPNNQ